MKIHEDALLKPPTFMFGYGSLMYPAGINGRGMPHRYIVDDLIKATLRGYKRGYYAPYFSNLYYGIKESFNDRVNGVIFQLFTEHDLEALNDSEQVGIVYELVDVTDLMIVDGCLPKDAVILTNVSMPRDVTKSRVSSWYARTVKTGIIKLWGVEYWNEFLELTEPHPKVNPRIEGCPV